MLGISGIGLGDSDIGVHQWGFGVQFFLSPLVGGSGCYL